MVYRVAVSHVTQFLMGVDIFQGLSERHLDRVASLCEERSFEPGEYLALSGVTGDRLYVVQRGEIRVTSGVGRDDRPVRTLRAREAFPVAVLSEPPVLVTTFRAVTAGDLYSIPRVRLLELCELEPRIGLQIYRAACGTLARRYRYALDQLDQLGDVTGRPLWQ